MAELLERALVALIVIGAAVYLGLHWSGALARLRARSKPDVPASRLVRKKPSEPDDCCR